MELTNEFTVPVGPDEAWKLLTDLERVAACLPGARLTEIDGDEHAGQLKVLVGPVTATYDGVARFVARDGEARRAVLRAEGSDPRQGAATATVTATLAAGASGGTTVAVVTDLAVAGKVGQFGHGVLADISVRLVAEFARCLAGEMEAERADAALIEKGEPSPAVRELAKAVADAAPTAGAGPVSDPGPRRIDRPEPEPVDLSGVAEPKAPRRLIALGVATGILALVLVGLRRRRR